MSTNPTSSEPTTTTQTTTKPPRPAWDKNHHGLCGGRVSYCGCCRRRFLSSEEVRWIKILAAASRTAGQEDGDEVSFDLEALLDEVVDIFGDATLSKSKPAVVL